MANKLNLPSVVGLNIENTSPGMITFLQAVQDSFVTVDNNVVYKDTIDVNVPAVRLRATGAQGQSFSVSGVNLASGEDFAVLVNDFRTLLQDVTAIQQYLTRSADKAAGKTDASSN